MAFDALIANPGRLKILTELARAPRQEFVELRGATRMTDGNLATHARRLQAAGMLDIDKFFRGGKPVTTFTLTHQGRQALEAHVQGLIHALEPARVLATAAAPVVEHPPKTPVSTATQDESDWID